MRRFGGGVEIEGKNTCGIKNWDEMNSNFLAPNLKVLGFLSTALYLSQSVGECPHSDVTPVCPRLNSPPIQSTGLLNPTLSLESHREQYA